MFSTYGSLSTSHQNKTGLFGHSNNATTMFGKISTKQTSSLSSFGANSSNVFTISQYNALVSLQKQYSGPFANKTYEMISSMTSVYQNILLFLKNVSLSDPYLIFMLRIALNTLTGAVNVKQLYSQYILNEIAINAI